MSATIVTLPARKETGRALLAVPLHTVDRTREFLLHLMVAAEIALATLDQASEYGPDIALDGVHDIVSAMAVWG